MFVLVLVAMAVAVFVGVRSERARQAHANWRSYKDRIETMRGTRLRETMRAVYAIALLVVVITVAMHV